MLFLLKRKILPLVQEEDPLLAREDDILVVQEDYVVSCTSKIFLNKILFDLIPSGPPHPPLNNGCGLVLEQHVNSYWGY